MRRLTTLALVGGLLASSLAGCSTLTAISSGSAPTVSEIQTDAVSVCGYLPTAETVTSILTKANAEAAAGAVLGSTIANLICGAVSATSPAKSARRGGVYPTVYGVPVRGGFVR